MNFLARDDASLLLFSHHGRMEIYRGFEWRLLAEKLLALGLPASLATHEHLPQVMLIISRWPISTVSKPLPPRMT
jgi:hypothetical protein